MSDYFDKESRKNWIREGQVTNDDLKIGCLQRIASAVELSCKDRERLERDYRYMRDDRDSWRQRAEFAERRVASLKGVITRMKKRAP